MKKRDNFNLMMERCLHKEKDIDLILTKSISRFARNTVDCLSCIRRLKERNIAIYFEKEHINTLESTGELLITILSSQAQEESRNISENVKWGLKRKYEKGEMLVRRMFGYGKGTDGQLYIIPEEAEVVRLIYGKYLEGESLNSIARILKEKGIKTIRGNIEWNVNSIRTILINEKYIGDAMAQKTFTTDYLTKTRKENQGELQKYYVENAHEAIIPRDIFTQVQEEILRRANMTSGRDGQKRRIYSSRYALSSICTCMKCGDIYRRVVWNSRGKKSVVWRCCTRMEHGPSACSAPTIPEEQLQQAVIDAMNTVLEYSTDVKNILEENILEVIYHDNSDAIDEINKVIAEKQKELLELVHGKKDYSKCADEMEELRQSKQLLLVEHAKSEGVKQRINELSEYIYSEDDQITEYDEKLVRKYIDQIKVYDDKFVICFKAKVEIVINR